ncbi:MAG: hypothetical protein LBC95_03105 [Candidatus Nomurabacteria bacterium]|jgi:phenylalanyl-tRNA synthetase beta chain|nr:hypothetical protein [Candidatus Nomurabacteria bacterium]
MIISLNWLKKYVDLSGVTTDELVELIGARLVEVEGVEKIGDKYCGAKIVKVVSAEKIEGSDHLSACQIDDAGVIKTVERSADGTVQVVCGANNVHAGMLAVWLPPGMTVPETASGRDPFVLESRKLMGVTSNGMLASIRELDMGDDHDGIVEIDPDLTFSSDTLSEDAILTRSMSNTPRSNSPSSSSQTKNSTSRKVRAGDDFASAFNLDDTLLDIENKSLTHRPDCFGIIGFAREVAGILGQKFVEPEILTIRERK